MSARDGLVDRVAIIGAISRHTRNLRIDLLKQNRHLASVINVVAGQHVRGDSGRPWIFSRIRKVNSPPSTTGTGRKFTTARFALIIARNQMSQSNPRTAN